jgi:hypothetical protein
MPVQPHSIRVQRNQYRDTDQKKKLPRFIAVVLQRLNQSQKFSTIQTLHSVVGAGIATYFPLCEGITQAA